MRYAERNTAAFSVGSEDRIKARSFGALEIWQLVSILLSARRPWFCKSVAITCYEVVAMGQPFADAGLVEHRPLWRLLT